MTQHIIKQLKQLIEEWRETARKAHSDPYANGLDQCAAELEASLAALPDVPDPSMPTPEERQASIRESVRELEQAAKVNTATALPDRASPDVPPTA